MQRTGRKGHAQFRLVVQDSRFSPSSGRVVTFLGSYNPHTKALTLDGEKLASYLDNGAQPSDRVVSLLQKEGIKLPSWVKQAEQKKRGVKNPEKLRRNNPQQAEEGSVKKEDNPSEDAAGDNTPQETGTQEPEKPSSPEK